MSRVLSISLRVPAAVAIVLSAVLSMLAPTASAAPSARCTPVPPGLVSWWTGEGNFNDIQGTNNGTPHGGVTFAAGEVGQAFSFNGSDAYVVVPDSESQHISGQISIEAWLYPVSHPLSMVVSKFDNASSAPGWSIDYYGTHYTIAPQAARFTVVSSPSDESNLWGPANSVPFNAWSHVVGVADGATTTLYVNGQPIASGPSVQVLASTFPLVIGAGMRGGNPEEFFNGLVDEVSLYNRALTAIEVQKLYSAGSAGKCQLSDLKVSKLAKPPASVHPGATFGVTDTTVNSSTFTAAASTTQYYLSLDPQKGGDDILLDGGRAVPTLLPGATSSGSTSVTVPVSAPLGTYYLIGCADGLNVISERNEKNNCRAAKHTVQVN